MEQERTKKYRRRVNRLQGWRLIIVVVSTSCLVLYLSYNVPTELSDNNRNNSNSIHQIATPPVLKIALGGDLLLSQFKTPQNTGPSICEQRSLSTTAPEQVWSTLLPYLLKADASFANLETPISNQPYRPLVHPNGFVKNGQRGFQVSSSVVSLLQAARFSAVSLANNHLLDIPTGVEDTLAALKDAGIGHAGAGQSIQEAQRPATVRVHNNHTVAFLSMSDLRSIHDKVTGFDETPAFVKTFAADADKPGIWDVATRPALDSLALQFTESDFEPLRQQIQQARDTHDVVVVALHYQPNVAGFQAAEPYKVLGRRILEAGADVFVGQHPHHMQEFEFHQGKPMIMGNGELIRAFGSKGVIEKMEYIHEILYQVHWPLNSQGRRRVSMDLILIEQDPDHCQVGLERDMEQARARVRKLNPGKTLIDRPYGLLYESPEPLKE